MLHYFSVGSSAMVIIGYGLVKVCRHLCGSQRFPQYTLFSALENLTINSYGGHTCNRMTWCYVCFAVCDPIRDLLPGYKFLYGANEFFSGIRSSNLCSSGHSEPI